MRGLEETFLFLISSGERPSFVPKEFRFEQAFAEGATIDRNERQFRTVTLLMDRSGYQFLARSRFASDQNCKIASGRCFNLARESLNRRRVANDANVL